MEDIGNVLGPLLFAGIVIILNIVKKLHDGRMKKEQKEARERRAQEGGGMEMHERARRQIYGDAIPTAKRRAGQPAHPAQPAPGPERQRQQALQKEEARRQVHEQAIREEETRRMHEAATERHAAPQNLDPRRMADRPVLREAGHDVRELFDDLMGRGQSQPQQPQRQRAPQPQPPERRQAEALSPQEQKRQGDLQRQRQRSQNQQRGREGRRRDRTQSKPSPPERVARQGIPSISETALDSPGGAKKLRKVRGQRRAQRIGAVGLFPDRGALRQAIVMTEVLGPPRAERELSQTRNWS